MEEDALPTKSPGRPKGTGSGNTKILRVIISPRQERILAKLRTEWGLSESEHVRRAIDDYIDKLVARGEVEDTGPTTAKLKED